MENINKIIKENCKNEKRIWNLKILIPLKKKNKNIKITMYLDCPTNLKTKDVCSLIMEKIKDNKKGKKNLFIVFGKKKHFLYPDTCPAFIQEKYAEFFGYNIKDIFTSKNKKRITRLLFVFEKTKTTNCNCDVIEGIDLSYTKRPDFFLDPPKAFKNFQAVYLNGNGLSKVPNDLLNKKVLRILDLCGNNIDTEQLHSLFEFSLLEKLCLKYNQIENLPKNFFISFGKMKTLVLDYNNIVIIESEIKNLKNLEILSINSNRLKTLPKEISELKKLRIIHASSNLIEEIHEKIFEMETLEIFNIKKNNFVANNLIFKTKNIFHIDLSKNNISENQLTSIDRNKYSFFESILINLKDLCLQKCKISFLSGEIFKKTPNLEFLDISKNNLFQLPQKIEILSKLKVFNVHGNNIRLIAFSFAKLQNLKSVDLHSNSITTIPEDIWYCPLSFLNLSDNNISEFPFFKKDENKQEKINKESPKENIKKEENNEKICKCFSSINIDNNEFKKKKILNLKKKERTISKDIIFILTKKMIGKNFKKDLNCIKKIEKSFLYKQCVEYKSNKKKENTLEKNLSFLNISQNKLTTKGIKSIKNISSLVWLNLSLNQIEDVSKLFPSLKNLVFFSFSNNNVHSFPKELKQAKNLKILLLSCNEITSIPSSRIKNLKKLRILDISYNNWNHKVNMHDNEWNWNQTPSLSILNMEGNTSLKISKNIYKTTNNFIERKKIFSLPLLKYINVENIQIPEEVLPFEKEGLYIKKTNPDVSGSNNFYAASFMQFGILKNISIHEISSRHFFGKEILDVFALFQSFGKTKISRKLHKMFPFILQEELFSSFDEKIEKILENIFMKMSIQIRKDIPKCKEICFVIVVICYKNKIYIANTGKNSAHIYKKNSSFCITNHKEIKENNKEKKNVFFKETCLLKSLFNFPFSNSFGFFHHPEITSIPKTYIINLKKEDLFLVIGTYNFWKKISHATIFAFLKENPLSIAAKKIRDRQTCLLFEPSSAIFVDLQKIMSLFSNEIKSLKKKKNSFLEIKENRSIKNLIKEVHAPIGKVTMAVTDIKKSSEHWSMHPQLMHSITSLHNDLMRRLLRSVGGYEVKKEGDSFFATFSTVEMAIKWCLMAQEEILNLELPDKFYKTKENQSIYEYEGSLVRMEEGFSEKELENFTLLYKGLSIRMGIHIANPIVDFDPITKRTDYFGMDVIKTHRICSIADGGEIAVSKQVYDVLCQYSQETIFDLEKPSIFFSGARKLKGFEKLEEIYIIYPKKLTSRYKYSKISLSPASFALENISLDFSNLSFEEGIDENN